MDNIAELHNLPHFESATECLEFIDSLLADHKKLFPMAERVEGGVRGANPTQRVSKAGNTRPASTVPPGGSNPRDYLHQIFSSCE